jgi:hypothetical protein
LTNHSSLANSRINPEVADRSLFVMRAWHGVGPAREMLELGFEMRDPPALMECCHEAGDEEFAMALFEFGAPQHAGWPEGARMRKLVVLFEKLGGQNKLCHLEVCNLAHLRRLLANVCHDSSLPSALEFEVFVEEFGMFVDLDDFASVPGRARMRLRLPPADAAAPPEPPPEGGVPPAPPAVPALVPPSAEQANAAIADIAHVHYVGVLRLTAAFVPPHTCREHMLADLPPVLPAVTQMDLIADECAEIAADRLGRLPADKYPGVPVLPPDQALAIVAYTYDLGFNTLTADGSDNFFKALNKQLQAREPAAMVAMRPYLA